jgi:glyoxylase-like metal-dependent hydrolase (beta-lactamase superfamily II)/8-oxo-dGTP pyrophosphatase MutT (NUDIX family)
VSKLIPAAALILLDHEQSSVLWAKRHEDIKFLGGFHAFPGGKIESEDADIQVAGQMGADLSTFLVGAVRETFEEIGILIVRGGEKLTKGQLRSLHDDLISKRSSFKEILDNWNLEINSDDFVYCGYWRTPNFSPVRFETHFFITKCPRKQIPYSAVGELIDVEFIRPKEALSKWNNAEVLVSPPVLLTLQTLSTESAEPLQIDSLGRVLIEEAQSKNGEIHFIQINSHVVVAPLRTKTLPPATHTNCFIVGGLEFIVIDAASREVAEQERLISFIDGMIAFGGRCKAILVSHLHPDHHGGETVVKDHFKQQQGIDVPILAHPRTAQALESEVLFDGHLSGDEKLILKDWLGVEFSLEVIHSPGHAKGHLCFYDRGNGFLISCDNVINNGSVVIAPPEGNMGEYIRSLSHLRELPDLKSLCGSHGTGVFDARRRIDDYLFHRSKREREVQELWGEGLRTAEDIASKIYVGLEDRLMPLAIKTVGAHLEYLVEKGSI